MTKISHLAVLLSSNPQTYPQELGITSGRISQYLNQFYAVWLLSPADIKKEGVQSFV